MSTATTQIIIQGKDQFSQPMAQASRRASAELEGIRDAALGVKSALAGLAGVFAFDRIKGAYGEYDTALRDMAKVTAESMDVIGGRIAQLPPQIGTATELMRGYYQVISAGVTEPARAMDTLVSSAKAAKSAHADQADAIKGVTKFMAAYAGQIKTASEATDLLFAIERQGQTSFQELIPIIGDVAAVSQAAGVHQREMAAGLAAVTQTAGSTSQAATQYRAAIMGLYKPTEKMQEALEALGVSSGKQAVQTWGLAGTLERLQDYAGRAGLGLGKLFESSEALLAVTALSRGEFAQYNANLRAMEAGVGGAARAYDTWAQSAQAVDELVRGSLTNAMQRLGQEIFPAYRDGATMAAQALDFIGEHARTAIGVTAVGAISTLTVAMSKNAQAGVAWATGTIREQSRMTASTIRLHQAVVAEAQAEVIAAERRLAAVPVMYRTVAAEQALVASRERLTAAQAALNTAQTKSTLVARGASAAMGALGGPIGLITTLLAAGATAWMIWGENAESAADKAKTSAEQATAAIRRMREAQSYGQDNLAVFRKDAGEAESALAAARERQAKYEAAVARAAELAKKDPQAARTVSIPMFDSEEVARAEAAVTQAYARLHEAARLVRTEVEAGTKSMVDGASAAGEALGGAANRADIALAELTETARQKLDKQYEALKGKVSDGAALERWYQAEVAKLNEQATKKFEAEQKKQTEEHRKARAAMRRNESVLDKWMEDYEQRRIDAVAKGVEERQKLRDKEAEDAAAAVKKIADEQEEAARRTMERIEDATADVFYDLFRNIDDGWSSLWESMKSWALRTLAEIAARAATTQIIVPILTQVTGSGTAASAIGALTGGGGGGGFSLSSLSNLVSPGSLLSKIPGFNTVSGLLATQLPGTAMLSGGAMSLAAGGTAGGNIASLAAAQNLAGMTGGLSIGSALGMGSLGGLGYSLLGGALGLPQNKYSGITSSLGGALGAWGGSALASSAAGAALGATAGSVLPVVGTAVGAILGGLGSSLFGGKKHSPSVIFDAQRLAWGSDKAFGYHTKSGASMSDGKPIAKALQQMAADTFASVEAALGAIGDQYVEMLQGKTITFGRKSGGVAGGAWDFGADKDMDALLKKYGGALQQAIFNAASGAFTAAGRDLAASEPVAEALGLLSDSAADSLNTLLDTIRAGVRSGNVQAYSAQLQSLQATIQTITGTWQAINLAADDLVKPPTAYEQAVRQADAQFDAWVLTLHAMGFAAAKIEELEAKREATLLRLNQEMGPLAEAEAARVRAIADAKSALIEAYRRESAEIEATARTWERFAESLAAWRASVLTGSMSALTADARHATASSMYADVLSRARLGDEQAVGGLLAAADTHLAAARATASTAADYARAVMRASAEVGTVEDVARRHADTARAQLDAMAEQLRALDVINESILSMPEALAAYMAALQASGSVPGFAAGGLHTGGLRIVGEYGPELEATGPARIWSAGQTRSLLFGGGDDGTATEIRALREDLRAIGRALAKNTQDTARLMRRWDGDGMPETRSVA